MTKATRQPQFKNYLALICLCSLLLIQGCLKRIPYEKSQVETFFEREENIQLAFTTDKGKQVAFYVPPPVYPDRVPEKIAILYPGIQAVALGWWNFIRLEDDEKAGYLLIDYPGRGFSEGMMHPEENYKNTEGALAALAKHFGIKEIDSEFCLLGHSFGTGAALQFAARQKVTRIVLVAPYNTLRKAVAQKSFILSVLMPAQIDNAALVKELLASDSRPEITIIHGSKDKLLPVEMGRELAKTDRRNIRYVEIPEGDHTSILTTHRALIFHTLLGLS